MDNLALMGGWALIAVAASLIILANLAADVFYAYLDPRIRPT